jgi:predicted anti-sigma-YlaC factor YlaD
MNSKDSLTSSSTLTSSTLTTPTTLTPCWHMKALLTAKIDGRLFGLLRYYVNLHLSQCPQCRATLQALEELRERLIALRNTTEEPLLEAHQQRIQTALNESLAQHIAHNKPPK